MPPFEPLSPVALQSGSSLQSLWNTLFWVSVALAGVLVLHAGLRALAIWRGWEMPTFLEVGPLPRGTGIVQCR